LPRHTRSRNQRRQASREADRLAKQAENLDRQITAEIEQAVAEAEVFDGRDLWTGQPIPGRPIQLSSPLDNLRRAAEEADAIAEKMEDRVKHAGERVRATALSNVAWAERNAQEARERWWEADTLARDYGGLTPCADPTCAAELPRSATYDTFGLCPAHYRVRVGISRPQP
jgi:hypothetical protein